MLVETHGEIVRNLSAHGENDALRAFEVDDVHHTLEGQFVEVEAVAHVIVGGDGLRIVVYHHAWATLIAHGLQSIDRTPVEFHRGTYAVSTRTENDDWGLLL